MLPLFLLITILFLIDKWIDWLDIEKEIFKERNTI